MMLDETQYDVETPDTLTTVHETSSEIVSNTTKLNVQAYPKVWLYVSPVIFFVGVCGNCLTIMVMRRKPLRHSTTAVYLILLAIADTAALFTRIPTEFFEAAGNRSFRNLDRWTCRFEKFLFYTFSDIAIWILVLFTVDRFIAVCHPFYKSKVCLPRRALAACGGVAALVVVKNFHVFWTRGPEYESNGMLISICGRPAYTFEHHIRPWIAFTTITAIPFLIIILSNLAIVKTLLDSRNKISTSRHRPSSRSPYSTLSGNGSTSVRASSRSSTLTGEQSNRPGIFRATSRALTQTTLMCLSTSVAFLICVSPSIILTLGRFKWANDPDSVYAFGIAQAINYQLSCLNHAINFFLYCLSGQRFRRELVNIFTAEDKNKSFTTRQWSRRQPWDKYKNSSSVSSVDRHENEETRNKLEPIKENPLISTSRDDDSDSPKKNIEGDEML